MTSTNSHPCMSNISATFHLNCKINLDCIIQKLNGRLIRKFRAVNIKVFDPFASANIFENGKVVINGTNSNANLKLAVKNICEKLRDIGIESIPDKLKIENCVASGLLNEKIDLSFTYNNIRANSKNMVVSYEPELFPGLICKDGKKVFTIFTTGKYIITGCKNEEEIQDIYEKNKLFIVFKDIAMEL